MEFKYYEIVKMKCNEIADFKCHDFMEFTMDSTGTHKIFQFQSRRKNDIFCDILS